MLSIPNQTVSFLALGTAGLSLLVTAYAYVSFRKLNQLKSIFFQGHKAADLENFIYQLHAQQRIVADELSVASDNIAKLFNRGSLAIQKIGLLRFNPFADGGGNFSFCLALL